MKKLLFTVVLFFSALVLQAQENTVSINGISYKLDNDALTAEVVKN